MDQFNLFEPDLELTRSTIPYKDMGIQGVWPRKQRTPSDIFPTNAALIGRGPNNDARWLATNADGVLLTESSGGGGGGIAPINGDISHLAYQGGALSNGGTGGTYQLIPIQPVWTYLFAIYGSIDTEGIAGTQNQGEHVTIGIVNDSDNLLLPLWTRNCMVGPSFANPTPSRLDIDYEPCSPFDIPTTLDLSSQWYIGLAAQTPGHLNKFHVSITAIVGLA